MQRSPLRRDGSTNSSAGIARLDNFDSRGTERWLARRLAGTLRESLGKPEPELSIMTRLPLEDPGRAADFARGYAELGASRVVHSNRYADAAEFARVAEAIASRIRPALA